MVMYMLIFHMPGRLLGQGSQALDDVEKCNRLMENFVKTIPARIW